MPKREAVYAAWVGKEYQTMRLLGIFETLEEADAYLQAFLDPDYPECRHAGVQPLVLGRPILDATIIRQLHVMETT